MFLFQHSRNEFIGKKTFAKNFAAYFLKNNSSIQISASSVLISQHYSYKFLHKHLNFSISTPYKNLCLLFTSPKPNSCCTNELSLSLMTASIFHVLPFLGAHYSVLSVVFMCLPHNYNRHFLYATANTFDSWYFFVIAAVAADDVANANVVAQLPNAIGKQRYCRSLWRNNKNKNKFAIVWFGNLQFFAFSLS